MRTRSVFNTTLSSSVSRDPTVSTDKGEDFRVSQVKFHQAALKSPSLPTSISHSPQRAFKDVYELQKEQCNRKYQVLASQISAIETKKRAEEDGGGHDIHNIRREISEWVKKSASSRDGE